MKHLYALFLAAAAVCLVAFAVLLATGSTAVGPVVVGFFVAAAVGVRRLPILREFSFAIWIFAAVSAAMFYPG